MARKKTEKLTPVQEELFRWLKERLLNSSKQPTLREMSAELHVVVSAIVNRLNALIEKGYVQSSGTGTRDRVLTILKDEPEDELVSIPILGNIACGIPIWSEENFNGEILMQRSKLGPGAFFALKASGDSMIDAGIENGDLVVIHQQPMAYNGEIVAAYIDGEVTLKRLMLKNGAVTLLPENKAYKPIVVRSSADFRVMGTFKLVSKVQKSSLFTQNND